MNVPNAASVALAIVMFLALGAILSVVYEGLCWLGASFGRSVARRQLARCDRRMDRRNEESLACISEWLPAVSALTAQAYQRAAAWTAHRGACFGCFHAIDGSDYCIPGWVLLGAHLEAQRALLEEQK